MGVKDTGTAGGRRYITYQGKRNAKDVKENMMQKGSEFDFPL